MKREKRFIDDLKFGLVVLALLGLALGVAWVLGKLPVS
jgi:hypothetical protein